ncbi:hypothetical protein PR048_031492 [Dryococelus australis]|uniref:Peptidase S1 domain-containing protein n=1 Tax=Dryococelus australis TaxID=614101 RepID=A0ABQ9G9H0_9NEOP|nr:hypothetical protein PR048_031492 [Dryococelus australis]
MQGRGKRETPRKPVDKLHNPARFPRDERIVGGQEALEHSFPYQAALFLPVKGGKSFCGGSVIADRWFLTAAHCVDSKGADSRGCAEDVRYTFTRNRDDADSELRRLGEGADVRQAPATMDCSQPRGAWHVRAAGSVWDKSFPRFISV